VVVIASTICLYGFVYVKCHHCNKTMADKIVNVADPLNVAMVHNSQHLLN